MTIGIHAATAVAIAMMLCACEQIDPTVEKKGTEAAGPVGDAGVTPADPFLWLEEILGEESLAWVRIENDRTLGVLATDPRFQVLEARALGIYNATDKIVYATRSGDEMHNLWRDEVNLRGLWRRTSVEAYAAGFPIWETVLDIDELARTEDRNWVYKGLSIRASDDSANDVFVSFESFLKPESLYRILEDGEVRLVQSLPERFDSSRYITEQKFATSADGAQIPYFMIRPKDIAFDGKRPTLLYGYGGFEISSTPAYTYPIGNSPNMTTWLEAGGTLVVANIRGGGEFGPKWHQAALKEKRQVAFDDMIAVAEHLIESGLTPPRHLGAMGRSNGGLLMGAMLTQRPDLFNAIVCGVPLLDMLRYHKLLAGASWIAEYGNPDVPEEAAYISTYSPYQKMGEKESYPEVLFYSSTRDDRVHPGHGRKMAARMRERGHSFLYYENIEGGHAGSSDLKQRAFMDSVQITYLMQKLMDQG